MNFNTPPLAQIAPFETRFASQTQKYHSTKKLRKHVCRLRKHVCTTQAFKPGQLHLDHSRVSKRPPRLVYHHSLVLKKRLLSLRHPRASLGSDWALKVVRQVLLCSCCHDAFIVRSAPNLSTVPWFHSVCAVSMFTINADNCLLLSLFLLLFLVSPSLRRISV